VTATAAAPPAGCCCCSCHASLSRHVRQAASSFCRACRRRRCCAVCNLPRAEPGKTWCAECRAGYQLASRVLMSFRACRPDPGVLAANLKKYRGRAARGLPLFAGPSAADLRAGVSYQVAVISYLLRPVLPRFQRGQMVRNHGNLVSED
jgi:hypothetical protein